MDDYEEIYSCASCGYEDDPDRFGTYCPNCGVNLDELEDSMNVSSDLSNH